MDWNNLAKDRTNSSKYFMRFRVSYVNGIFFTIKILSRGVSSFVNTPGLYSSKFSGTLFCTTKQIVFRSITDNLNIKKFRAPYGTQSFTRAHHRSLS